MDHRVDNPLRGRLLGARTHQARVIIPVAQILRPVHQYGIALRRLREDVLQQAVSVLVCRIVAQQTLQHRHHLP